MSPLITRGIPRRTVMRGLSSLGALCLWSSPLRAQQRSYAVILPDGDSEYYSRMRLGIETAAREMGNIALSLTLYKEISEAANSINNAIKDNPEGFLLSFFSGYQSIFADISSIVTAAGIPLVTIGHSLPAATASVVPDWDQAGRLQAQQAMVLAAPPVTIVYLAGPGAIDAEIEQAFKKALSEQKVDIVSIRLDGYSVAEASQRTIDVLSRHDNVAVIVASSDSLTIGALQAIKPTNSSAKVVGLGASLAAMAALKENELSATIDLKPDVQGSEALRALNDLVQRGVCKNGQNPPCPPQTVQPAVVVAEGRK